MASITIKEGSGRAQAAISQTQPKIIKDSKVREFISMIKSGGWSNIKRLSQQKALTSYTDPFRVVAKIFTPSLPPPTPDAWGLHNVFHAGPITRIEKPLNMAPLHRTASRSH